VTFHNPIKTLIDWCRGRHTFFCFCFFVSGHVLHLLGKLSHTYIEYMACMMSFILGHSIKDDYFEAKAATASPTPTPQGAEAG
jgi:hypothetical protein